MLIVTIAALVMAASLGWFAFRLMQEEQRRSDARVALLTAALQGDGEDLDAQGRPSAVGFAPRRADVKVPEVVVVDDDSRPAGWFRSEHLPETEPVAAVNLPAADTLRATQPTVAPGAGSVDTRPSGLFAEIPDARPADARGAIALGGAVLVGALALGYVWFGRPAPAPEGNQARAVSSAATAAARGGVPLELLALSHVQRAGVIEVRGQVRNPLSGSDRTALVASVMLLDQAGGVLGNGRAPVVMPRLRPGDATDFVVEIPAHKDVRRYRVTFRGVDGALVPHADKRVR